MALVHPRPLPNRSLKFFSQAVLATAADNEEADADAASRPELVSMVDFLRFTPEPVVGVLRFEGVPFQAPESESTAGPGLPGLYSEEVAQARDVCIKKSTQVGVSAYCWRWSARRCDQFGDRCIYVFPTDGHVVQFARERIEPSLQESPYLAGRMSTPDNAHQKRIGDGFLILRGAVQTRKEQRAAGAQSVAAQSLVVDEYDDCNPATIAQLERRLSGAASSGRIGRIRRVGVPTIPEYGIDLEYQNSDQRWWAVHCTACGLEQEVEFAENVRWRTSLQEECRRGDDLFEDERDVLEAWRVCRECEARIDVGNGRWLARRPEATTIGFHVSRLIVPGVDLLDVVRNSRKTAQHDVEAFYQNDLGLAYESADAGLSAEAVERIAQTDGVEFLESYAGEMPVTMGVDTAGSRDLNVRISVHREDGTRDPLWVGAVPSFEALLPLIDTYNVWMCLIDANPERRKAREIAAVRPGRVFLCQFDKNVDAVKFVPSTGLVVVNRTDALDAMYAAVRDGRHRIPRFLPRLYARHLAGMKRRLVWDGQGRPTYRYDGANMDYAMAEAYDVAARDWLVAAGTQQDADQLRQYSGPDGSLDFTGQDF